MVPATDTNVLHAMSRCVGGHRDPKGIERCDSSGDIPQISKYCTGVPSVPMATPVAQRLAGPTSIGFF